MKEKGNRHLGYEGREFFEELLSQQKFCVATFSFQISDVIFFAL